MKRVIIIFFSATFAFLGLSVNSFSQNVGIGIINPTRAKLEVNGAVGFTTAIFGGESTGISLQRNWPSVGFNQYYDGSSRYIGNGYAAVMYVDPGAGYMAFDMLGFGAANSTVTSVNRSLTLTGNGNVGIGGAIPNAPLQFPNVGGNRKIVLYESANNNHQFFGLGIEAGALRYSVAGIGDAHRFYSGSSATSSDLLMSIWGDRTVTIGDDAGGGKLGINLSSPAYTLHVRQAGGTGICLQESAFNTTWQFQATSFTGGTSNHLNLIHQGNVVGQFGMNGVYTSYSDSRLKKNIQVMPDLLDKVMKLNPVIYEMKKNNPDHKVTAGFIAQEVKPLFPELVYINENPEGAKEGLANLHALNYSGFGVLAIKAIQEQQQQIEKLKNENTEQRKQNEELLKRIKKLESVIKLKR